LNYLYIITPLLNQLTDLPLLLQNYY